MRNTFGLRLSLFINTASKEQHGLSVIKYIYMLTLGLILFQSCGNTPDIPPASLEEPEEEVSYFYGHDISEFKIDSGVVEMNQGLAHILPYYGISHGTIHQIATKFDSVFDVRKIKANNKYYMFCKKDSLGSPKCFIYEQNAIDYVVFDFEDSLNVYVAHKEVEIKTESASGEVTSSLWNAFVNQGLSPALVMEVSKLFAWSIDFFGIQKGDYFKVIYESKYVDGQAIGIGNVQAVLFNHMGKDYYSFRHQATDGKFAYYTEEGESMKRALLSAPLEYTRISSRFSNSRFHPVLKIYRPHHGVDYAAPTGTEVVATGDGIVTKAAYSGGAGNMVTIKHSVGNIETKYLHLSKYGPGIKKGTHVSQGQKIGEVGSTGTSTGPHLDYRIYINGKAVNPLSIDIPSGDPLKGAALDKFNQFINPIKQQIDSLAIKKMI